MLFRRLKDPRRKRRRRPSYWFAEPSAGRSLITRSVWLFLLVGLLAPDCGWAQVRPHRASYILRLGAAANAPRIGTAVQDITVDCKGWHIKRDVLSEIAFTPSLKVSIASKLDGEESLDGKSFRYHSVDVQNGIERNTRGAVQRANGELRVEILSPSGPLHLVLPPPTLMPVAGISYLTSQLLAGSALVQTPVFGAEASGAAFWVEVKEINPESIRPLPPTIKPVSLPAQKFWAISATVAHALEQAQKPLFLLRARIFESGVLDRLTIDTGVFTVTADLETLEMRKAPVCTE